MARERVGFNGGSGGITFRKYTDASDGDVLVAGWFLESRKNNFEDNKSDYIFETEGGEKVMLNHCAQLAHGMAGIVPGTWVEVEYGGKSIVPKGPNAGKSANNVAVFIDRDKSRVACEKPAEELPF